MHFLCRESFEVKLSQTALEVYYDVLVFLEIANACQRLSELLGYLVGLRLKRFQVSDVNLQPLDFVQPALPKRGGLDELVNLLLPDDVEVDGVYFYQLLVLVHDEIVVVREHACRALRGQLEGEDGFGHECG